MTVRDLMAFPFAVGAIMILSVTLGLLTAGLQEHSRAVEGGRSGDERGLLAVSFAAEETVGAGRGWDAVSVGGTTGMRTQGGWRIRAMRVWHRCVVAHELTANSWVGGWVLRGRLVVVLSPGEGAPKLIADRVDCVGSHI
ncbi:hypothetical protein GCM10009764_38870 [Nocardia ninae]|uniref:Uncharacterized protein n=1 Tax=Nocardia ninae NBRC 108245 TaxID=1210091 RepID=A0A511MPL8_9NOCA|nr:hypothetical protein NN4_69300 [Nocardia ninae NBRC 108245]